ncbi:MAG TPA: hypothetical protein VM513_09685 [Kofleriaceae bacterium]|nr:hypothetical protein [Kofleriaceae bacterium]
MRALLASLAASALASLAACTAAPDPIGSCEEATAILASCEGSTDADCSDASPAAQFVADGHCSGPDGKADVFGNRTWGEACTWNWQCQQDTRHTCNHGTCYLRSEIGQACDRRDNADCSTGLRCADDLTVPSKPDGVCQLTGQPVRPALYAETSRPNETRDYQEHAQDIMGIQLRTAMKRLNGDDEIRRAFHAKRHVCTTGTFETVAAPADLAVGPVFGNGPKTFPAYVRLSNGTLSMLPDEHKGVQGLAIKLVGVTGPKILDGQTDAVTQDFLLVNLPAIPNASANEFIEFTKAQERGTAAIAHYLLTHPRTAIRIAKVLAKRVDSARTETFWAANANRHGSRLAVKYIARPCAGTPAALPTTGPDFLRADIKATLATRDICFDFYAQRQTDSVAMSIEDSTSEWSETASPPVRIGRVTIPATALDTAASNATEAFCNELSFNPWHSAPEHRPLGDMNRSRKFAYEASTGMRGASPEPRSIP